MNNQLGLIGEESFVNEKEAILINVGRGGIVDEEALAEAFTKIMKLSRGRTRCF